MINKKHLFQHLLLKKKLRKIKLKKLKNKLIGEMQTKRAKKKNYRSLF